MVVLLQSGKAADLAGAFGGGGSQTALGSRGAATVLTKATTVCAILFMLASLGLALYGSRRGGSVLEQVPVETPPSPPAAAAPAAPQPSAPGSAPAEGQKAPAEQGAAPEQPKAPDKAPADSGKNQ